MNTWRALRLPLLCALAALLSWLYLSHYLRGGPRIIDATSYFLQAKTLAAGGFSFTVPSPLASFGGRFLLATPERDALGVIFPPGYPMLLSLGVRAGVPLLVGPALGAALVAATYGLARAVCDDGAVALTAALLSALSAALRYHTADTMSHGLSALLATTALMCALRHERRGRVLAAGLLVGWLLATRPVSGAVSVLLVAFTLRRTGLRAGVSLALGLLPGIALLLLQQHALTGSFFRSTQIAYYAAADWPSGCFRYGFGQGIGCRFEHGDYVQRFLPDGYGFVHAVRNLAVRSWLFLLDSTNLIPLTLLAPYALYHHRRSQLVLLGAGIALQALAYVPFYFDGNYPGGGARFLCEAIPLCQVLVARALVDLRIERFAAPLALAGFALHARYGHEALRDREGGRPMFEPAVVARAGVHHGLVFVDTDHGFNLGYDPRSKDPNTGLLIARLRADGHDWQLYERLGRPTSYRYSFDTSGKAEPTLEPFIPRRSLRFEGEAHWPADLVRGAAYPIHYPCASRGRALRLYPGTQLHVPLGDQTDQSAELPSSGDIEVGWVTTGPGASTLEVGFQGAPARQASAQGPGCHRLLVTLPRRPEAAGGGQSPTLAVTLSAGQVALDYISKTEPSAVTR